MSRGWTAQRERGNRFMLGVLAWLALHLGRRSVRVILYFVALYFLVTGTEARRASQHYLTTVLGRRASWWQVYRHFLTFAVVSVDRLFFLAGRGDSFQVEVHGEEVFERLRVLNRGALLLVAHIGSFDAMRVPGAKTKKLPIRILMDRRHNPIATALIEKLDPDLAAMVIDTGGGGPELALAVDEALKQGQLVGVMADRVRGEEAALPCRIFDAPASLPASPWALALVLKAPVVLCFGLYRGGNRYSIHFELMSEGLSAPRRERQRKLAEQAQHYGQRLEFYTRQAPFNWFNFYRFWDDETLSDH